MTTQPESQWNQLSAEKQALLQQRLRGSKDTARKGSITPRADQSQWPMSAAQTRLWFLTQLTGQTATYNEIRSLRIEGDLDIGVLQASLDRIVHRHEGLRANFTNADGNAVQTIRPPQKVQFQIVDVSGSDNPDQSMRQLAIAAGEIPFNLARDLLIRAYLYRISPHEHVLCLIVHSIVCDGLSVSVLYRELAANYTAFKAGDEPRFEPLPIQYADYAAWQRLSLQGEHLSRLVDYWKTQLADLEPLVLPTDRPRPANATQRGSQLELTISPDMTQGLQSLARTNNATLYMVLMALLQTLLHRLTGQDDIAIGSMSGSRTHAALEPLIGYFINLLVMRTDFSGNPTFTEILKQVRATALSAYEHQDLPFERIVEELQPVREATSTPLVQVLFTLKNAPPAAFETSGIRAVPEEIHTRTAAFDLSIEMFDHGSHLTGWLTYNTDIFDQTTMLRLRDQLAILIDSVVSSPQTSVAKLPMMSEPERRLILEDYAGQQTTYPPQTLLKLIEDRVNQTPDAPALFWQSEAYSYSALTQRANQLAHYIADRSRTGHVIAIYMRRSPRVVEALLAVLKSGNAFLLLDPADPPERTQAMLHSSGIQTVITQHDAAGGLNSAVACTILLDDEANLIAQQPTDNLEVAITQDDIAYHIYTSGSTGTPKGIAISHRQMVIGNSWLWERYPPSGYEVACQRASMSFQDFIWELFAHLPNGIPVALLSDDETRDAHLLVDALRRFRISRMLIIPSFLNVLLNIFSDLGSRLPDLKFWVVSGESAPQSLIESFQRAVPDGRLFNLYGTSEVSDIAWHEATGSDDTPTLPVGRPIPNVHIFILDRWDQPVPLGVQGVIWIGTDGLPTGYLNRAAQTAKRFRNIDLGYPIGVRKLYQTGDVGQWREDGTIVITGRADHQVKVRGYRVELEEVESALQAHPAIQNSVVIHHKDELGNQLVAYYVLNDETDLSPEGLRDFLKDRLPNYMVPGKFMQLSELPLTPSGKLNRRALPLTPPFQQKAVTEPRTEIEMLLTGIWEELLGVHPIGIHDDFFGLGGHSLLAVRLFAEIEKATGKVLPLAMLFEKATIEHLARAITQPNALQRWSSLVPIQPNGTKPPIYCVHGIQGDVIEMRALAQALGDDQPFYGLQAKGLSGQEEPLTRIEEMAARYVSEIRAHQPNGPYHLIGHSYGGKVAFEVAQQLLAVGAEVGVVGLLDSRLDTPMKRSRNWKRLPHRIARYTYDLAYYLVSASPPDRAKVLKATFNGLRNLLTGKPFFKRHERQRPISPYATKVKYANKQAWLNYKPQHYAGHLTFFLTSVVDDGVIRPDNTRHHRWRKLVRGGMDVIRVSGSHTSMIRPPHVHSLALHLQKALEKANKQLR